MKSSHKLPKLSSHNVNGDHNDHVHKPAASDWEPASLTSREMTIHDFSHKRNFDLLNSSQTVFPKFNKSAFQKKGRQLTPLRTTKSKRVT